jgi:hypothetical protein
VLLNGDPSTNIRDNENVEVVFKDGVGYDSKKLIESVKGQGRNSIKPKCELLLVGTEIDAHLILW